MKFSQLPIGSKFIFLNGETDAEFVKVDTNYVSTVLPLPLDEGGQHREIVISGSDPECETRN